MFFASVGALLFAGGGSRALAANQPPVVQLGANIGVLERDLGLLTFDGWAPVLLPGPSSESGQALTVQVEVLGGTYCDEHPDLSLQDCAEAMFDIEPGIDPGTGTLAFATAPATDGEVRLRAVVQDDGGTGDGGVDTASADFTITLNRAEPTANISVRNPWRSPCVPIQIKVDPTNYNKDDVNAWYFIDTYPAHGFLDAFVRAPASRGVSGNPVAGAGMPWVYRLSAGPVSPYAVTLCYIPFNSTFTGFDTFTYHYDDGHGGPPVIGIVSIEIFEI